jgi:hypothetical protein
MWPAVAGHCAPPALRKCFPSPTEVVPRYYGSASPSAWKRTLPLPNAPPALRKRSPILRKCFSTSMDAISLTTKCSPSTTEVVSQCYGTAGEALGKRSPSTSVEFFQECLERFPQLSVCNEFTGETRTFFAVLSNTPERRNAVDVNKSGGSNHPEYF